eukprot:53110_1
MQKSNVVVDKISVCAYNEWTTNMKDLSNHASIAHATGSTGTHLPHIPKYRHGYPGTLFWRHSLDCRPMTESKRMHCIQDILQSNDNDGLLSNASPHSSNSNLIPIQI